MTPAVTIVHDRSSIVGMTPDRRIEAANLSDALTREWPSDSHFAAYEPIEVATTTGGEPDGGHALIRARMHPRPNAPDDPNADRTSFNTSGAAMHMVALVGDVDGPDHVASDEWRDVIEPRLEATGLAWYRTRGGARLVALLDQPFIVDTPTAATEWRSRYAAWCDALAAAGIEVDRACSDPTRVFRLPNVTRDGQIERAAVSRQPPVVTLPPPAVMTPTPHENIDAPARPGAAQAAGVGALLGALGDWRDWDGRKHDLVGALGGLLRKAGWARADCERLIRTWLRDAPSDVNVEHGVRWACAAWQRDPVEVSGRAAFDLVVGADIGAAVEQAAMLPGRAGLMAFSPPQIAASADEAAGWRVCRFADPEEPIDYRCRDLCLATSHGKISLIAGQPGAGKGPVASHLAICLATGAPAFGFAPCLPGPTLLLDWEGSRLTMRRLRRMARAMGRDTRSLDDVLTVIDASGHNPASEVWQSELERRVRSDGIKVVVIDSYTSAMLATGIEANSTGYASLALLLGRLDCLVIAVAHANKAAALAAKPRLADVAGTGALAALAQTAILVHQPDDADEHRIRLSCARGPEGRFAAFDARFSDVDSGLSLERVETPAPIEAKPKPRGAAGGTDHNLDLRAAGARMLRAAVTEPRQFAFSEIARLGGEPNTIARRALARLTDAGLLEHGAGRYWATDAGRAADDGEVAAALGAGPGGFNR